MIPDNRGSIHEPSIWKIPAIYIWYSAANIKSIFPVLSIEYFHDSAVIQSILKWNFNGKNDSKIPVLEILIKYFQRYLEKEMELIHLFLAMQGGFVPE
ncbi:MAG: hypothetical protein KJ050_01145 [Candidatus Omnitrophica bacterium]|nr:hypothetical protein [bacterium]MCC6732141.1 hypothetical protein [Candidatus Omnitrophota bacterium]MCK6495481.1 hypothetical protein [bacterium]MCL4733511.1 hypothetical protein [Candidatus Omnitrophota bacterium]